MSKQTPFFRNPAGPPPFDDEDRLEIEDYPTEAEREEDEDLTLEDPSLESERGRGCGWFLVLGLAVLLGLFVGGGWIIHKITTRGTVAPLKESFPGVSLLPAARVQPSGTKTQIQIYYIARGQALVADKRWLLKPAQSEMERIELVARELARPASSGFLQSPLPPGTKIRGKYLLDGFLWVDLSADFMQVKNPSPLRERLVIYALVNSFMLNETGLKGVRFLIKGEPVETAWGWLDLTASLGPDLSLIR